MGVKIYLSIELEEFYTVVSTEEIYKCRLKCMANGVKKEFVFDDPITALNEARHIVFSWVQTFVKLKRNTKVKLRKHSRANPRIIQP